MPSKVSKNKKPLEIEKIEEPENKMTKQQQREKLKLELAILNSDSEIEEESPVIERVKNIKQKDSSSKCVAFPSRTFDSESLFNNASSFCCCLFILLSGSSIFSISKGFLFLETLEGIYYSIENKK